MSLQYSTSADSTPLARWNLKFKLVHYTGLLHLPSMMAPCDIVADFQQILQLGLTESRKLLC